MTLYGSVTNNSGIIASMKAMQLEIDVIGIHHSNVLGFDKVGYQRKEPVISSFAELLGPDAISQTTDTTPGRMIATSRPLDLALSEKGYFQVQGDDGVKLTRDGRFKLDNNGYLLTQTDENVLSSSGVPVKLPYIPKDLSNLKIDKNGTISVFNKQTLKPENIANIGVVSDDNILVVNPNVRQGYTEYSNVQIGSEFMRMVPYRRNFDANRRMLMIQTSVLNTIISKLSSAS